VNLIGYMLSKISWQDDSLMEKLLQSMIKSLTNEQAFDDSDAEKVAEDDGQNEEDGEEDASGDGEDNEESEEV